MAMQQVLVDKSLADGVLCMLKIMTPNRIQELDRIHGIMGIAYKLVLESCGFKMPTVTLTKTNIRIQHLEKVLFHLWDKCCIGMVNNGSGVEITLTNNGAAVIRRALADMTDENLSILKKIRNTYDGMIISKVNEVAFEGVPLG